MPEAKQNERLLTKEDWQLRLGWQLLPDNRELALLNMARRMTLKEVGEWLIKHYHGETWLSAKGQHSLYEIMLSELEALKRGEMLE